MTQDQRRRNDGVHNNEGVATVPADVSLGAGQFHHYSSLFIIIHHYSSFIIPYCCSRKQFHGEKAWAKGESQLLKSNRRIPVRKILDNTLRLCIVPQVLDGGYWMAFGMDMGTIGILESCKKKGFKDQIFHPR